MEIKDGSWELENLIYIYIYIFCRTSWLILKKKMHNQIKIQEHNKEMNSSLHENIYRFSKNRSSDRWVSEVRVVHHQITWNLGPYACNCKAQKARIYKCKRSVTIKDPIVVWPRTQCGNQKPIEISAPLLLIRGRERTGKLGPEHYLENMLCFGLTHLSISLSLSLSLSMVPPFRSLSWHYHVIAPERL